MDIRIDAHVQCTDGPGGQVKCIIVNPLTQQVTDIVVHKAGILGEDVIVPIADIAHSVPALIHLLISRSQLLDQQRFMSTRYLVPDGAQHHDAWIIGRIGMGFPAPIAMERGRGEGQGRKNCHPLPDRWSGENHSVC